MRFLKRLKSGNFWISMISAVVLILQAVFNVEIKTEYLNQIILGILGILVMSGIVSESPSNEISIKPNDIVNALDKVGDKISQVLSTEGLPKLKSEEQNNNEKGELNSAENSSKNNVENLIKNILKENMLKNCEKNAKTEEQTDIVKNFTEKQGNQTAENVNENSKNECGLKILMPEKEGEVFNKKVDLCNLNFQDKVINCNESEDNCGDIENNEKCLNNVGDCANYDLVRNQIQNNDLQNENEDVL